MKHFVEFSISDIDRITSSESGRWKTECRQISSGRLNFHTQGVNLGGVEIYWNTFAQSLCYAETFIAGGLAFAIPLGFTQTPTLYSKEVRIEDGMLFVPGREMNYVAHAGTCSLVIEIESAAIANRLRRNYDAPILSLHNKGRNRLVRHCRRITNTLKSSAVPSGNAGKLMIDQMREETLQHLETALEPWRKANGNTRRKQKPWEDRPFELVREMKRYLRRLPADNQPNIPELAAKLGVPERTAYRTFKH